MFGRAIISRSALDARTFRLERARVERSRGSDVESPVRGPAVDGGRPAARDDDAEPPGEAPREVVGELEQGRAPRGSSSQARTRSMTQVRVPATCFSRSSLRSTEKFWASMRTAGGRARSPVMLLAHHAFPRRSTLQLRPQQGHQSPCQHGVAFSFPPAPAPARRAGRGARAAPGLVGRAAVRFGVSADRRRRLFHSGLFDETCPLQFPRHVP